MVRIPNVPTEVRYFQAVLSLKVGDRDGYRAACAGIGPQVPSISPQPTGGVAYDAAMVFTVGPDATDDWAKPMAWIDHCLARLGAHEKANLDQKDRLRREWHLFLRTRGALLFRAGRWAEAAKVQGEALSYHAQGGDFHNWVFLALAEHRLGHADAARKAAAKARQALAGPKPSTVWERAEMELLAAELDAALPQRGK